jgi:hypothetical protein
VFFTPKRRPSAGRLLGRRERSHREHREYATSLTVTGAVQVALALSLLAAGFFAWRAIEVHARTIETPLRLGLPLTFAFGAWITLRSGIRNLRLAREVRSQPGADEVH